MNQNMYTVEVEKVRSLTILPQMRNIFTREIMAANANRNTVLLENVPDTIIKRITRETGLRVYANGSWSWIPVRLPEHIIDQILNGTLGHDGIDDRDDEIEQSEVLQDEESPIHIQEEELPVVEENDLHDRDDDYQDQEQSLLEEEPIITPAVDASQPFRSVPRNNGKNRNNNGKNK